MMKPRITYNIKLDCYICQYPQPKGDICSLEWQTWLASPCGSGGTPKEAFINWYINLMEYTLT